MAKISKKLKTKVQKTKKSATVKTIEGNKPPIWKNRQRVLIICSRGISHQGRHLIKNFHDMMPHSKTESKMEKKESLVSLNEIAEMHNCQNCLYLEMRKQRDLYMWISKIPNGPSCKFLLENLHTMGELKMPGNCLKGSRPLLSFSQDFENLPHLSLIKAIMCSIFNVPLHHPKSQPFTDHVIQFSYLDHRIWFRNYQIVDQNTLSLTEIGPRFALNPIKIFGGSFSGSVLWENPLYIAPNMHFRLLRKSMSEKYVRKVEAKRQISAKKRNYENKQMEELEDIFDD